MALHLTGPVYGALGERHEQAWVVGESITFTDPGGEHQIVDGAVLPGLVDVHCHIGLDAHGGVSDDVARAQAVADRDSGVTLVRDAGVPADTSWMSGEPGLPRVIHSGRHLARTKRYIRNYALELDDVADLPSAVEAQARSSDGWVKIVADWIDRDLGDLAPLWPDEVLGEAVRRAHDLGVRVTAHTFSHEALPGLLAAGVDGLEHACGADEQIALEIAQRGIPVTPTLLQVDTFLDIARQADAKFPRFAARMRDLHARRFETVQMLAEAGVFLPVGTDAGGVIEHGRIADEMAQMVEAGLAVDEVIAAATWSGRKFLGQPGLGEGERADFVVYDSDPHGDIGVLQRPRAVYLAGVAHFGV